MPFEPFDDFSATPDEHEELAALLWQDKRRNLLRRFTYFSDQDPERVVARMGFVPLVVQHGFATLSLSRSRGPSAVCTVGWFYSFGVPDVILIDTRWRVELDLGHALERAGKQLAQRGYRFRGLPPERAASKAVRRGLQWAAQPLRSLRPARDEDLELHPYGFGSYFYRHYMDRLDVPLLVGHTGSTSLELPPFAHLP
ncbi:MAG: hypothetical protein KDD82_18590 [Planctomycetes bacterium]|nr:hypothetical protein [Planctomycetota bacterium]